MQRPAPGFSTSITELFGIEHPIIAGGLMHLADADYVAAIVNAGCMGFMTAKTFPDQGAFREELQKARALASGKPFGVNFYLSAHANDTALVSGHMDIALEEGVRFYETSGLPPRALLPQLKEAGARVMHKVATVRHAVSTAKLDVDAIAVVGAECGGHPGLELIGSMVQTVRAGEAISKPLAVGGG
ncbi:MAG: nitronate monooxygenase, partial [Pseudomonadota bacterium]|nr:nitronate monooxygenase [Pseudomonadota bacterium]